jgi:hypothetical protein
VDPCGTQTKIGPGIGTEIRLKMPLNTLIYLNIGKNGPER